MKGTLLFPLFALVLFLPIVSSEAQNRAATPMIFTVAGGTFGNGGLATQTGIGAVYSVATDSSGNLYLADTDNFMIRKVTPSGIISTFAGNGIPTGLSGVNLCDADFPSSSEEGCGGEGQAYPGDSQNGDGRTAVNAEVGYVDCLQFDGKGNFYFSDSYTRIRKVDTQGIISTVAGNGVGGLSGDGGPATVASIDLGTCFNLDPAGNIYFVSAVYSDSGPLLDVRIRKVGTDGLISTYAGNGTPGYSGNGVLATQAEVNPVVDEPYYYHILPSLPIDRSGNLYFVDYSNRIRTVDTNGIIATVAGNGTQGYSGDKGKATDAAISPWSNLVLDTAGNIYFVNSGNGIRMVATNGIITTIAGNGTSGGSGDGGPAVNAEIAPYTAYVGLGLSIDNKGNIYFTNGYYDASRQATNLRARKVATDGIITTVAGDGVEGSTGDGGPATAAEVDGDIAALDSVGNLFLYDAYNTNNYTVRIRRVDASGTITTYAGNGTEGYTSEGVRATSTEIDVPGGIAVDGNGNLYVADYNNYRIRKVSSSGAIATVAGNGENCLGTYLPSPCPAPGPAVDTLIGPPYGIAVDGDGNVYFTSQYICAVYKVNSAGMLTTFAGNPINCGYGGDGELATSALFNHWVAALTVDKTGNLYIADTNNYRVRKVDTKGIVTTVAGNGTDGYSGDNDLAINAEIGQPGGIAVDATGNLYIADGDNFRVRKVDTNGIITTYAGTGVTGFSGDNGPASSAQISDVTGLAVDKAGNLYLGDFFNNRIRKVNPSGIITTVTGNGTYGYSGDGGAASDAVITVPGGLAVDSTGALYFGDVFNYRVRKIVMTAPAISAISPDYGAPAAFINIAGTNFGAAQSNGYVTVGGAPSEVTAWSNAAITIRVPSRASTGELEVGVNGESSNGEAFTFYGEPSITGLSVTSGPAGTPVTVTGINLLDGGNNATVTFNGIKAHVSSDSSGSIQVTVPPGATSGPIRVLVNGVLVSSPTSFTVTLPQINSISPTYGAPAAFINITGSNFGATQGNGYVTVGGAFSEVTAWSNDAITIRVPSRASTGKVVVVANGESSNGESFTFYGEPSITGVSPSSGSVGTVVTIYGSNLLDGGNNATVTFNGITAHVFNDSSGSIQVTVPPGATSGRVLVRVNGVIVIASTNFTVTVPDP